LGWFINRRKQQETARQDRSSRNPVELNSLENETPDITASTSNLVYQNVVKLQQPAKGKLSYIGIRIK